MLNLEKRFVYFCKINIMLKLLKNIQSNDKKNS